MMKTKTSNAFTQKKLLWIISFFYEAFVFLILTTLIENNKFINFSEILLF